jgi:putative ABC transport system permease protein
VALGAGIVAGLVPALQASNPDVVGSLKVGARDVGPSRSRLRGALVVIQAALSVMLLAGAALFVRSLQNVQSLDIGYDTQRLVFGEVRFYANDTLGKASRVAAMRAVADRVQGLPGVERVALAGMRPMYGFSMFTYFTDKEFPPGKAPMTTFSAVSPEYFATTGLRVVQGSNFPPVRGASMPRVTLVNRAMVDAVWPGENVIGKCIRFEKRDAPCYSVIGVVETARRDQVIEQQPAPQYYLPLDNMPARGWSQPSLVVRVDPRASAAVVREVQRLLHDTWPTGEPSVIRMADFLAPEYRPWRLGATLFTIFGLLALVVAAIGIYSAVSYAVNQRIHEFGIRVALGAGIGDVLRQVIGEGLGPVVIGLVFGIGLSLAAGRFIASLLYGIEPSNPVVMLAVSGILVGVATLAALSPGWRATRVDPMTALRAD